MKRIASRALILSSIGIWAWMLSACAPAGDSQVAVASSGVTASQADAQTKSGDDDSNSRSADSQATQSTQAFTYSPPITIRAGGTYSGSWESTDPAVPAVLIDTIEPVIIQDCQIQSRGIGIHAPQLGSDLTVRNCTAQGLDPGRAGLPRGRFISAYGARSLIVEHTSQSGTAGIYLDGAGMSPTKIIIRYNSARDVLGQYSDGNGGFAQGFEAVQFVQLNAVVAAGEVEIAWNEVLNQPWISRVEDNINLYHASGTAERPILVHDNFIQGAYPINPLADAYSGGGIAVDGSAGGGIHPSAYIRIESNQVVATSNHGIAIAAGHDVTILDNRVFSSGLLGTGQIIKSANVGVYVANWYQDATGFGNHMVTGNLVGWNASNLSRNDFWFVDCVPQQCAGNVQYSGSVSLQTQADEYVRWQRKVADNGVVIGATGR